MAQPSLGAIALASAATVAGVAGAGYGIREYGQHHEHVLLDRVGNAMLCGVVGTAGGSFVGGLAGIAIAGALRGRDGALAGLMAGSGLGQVFGGVGGAVAGATHTGW